MPARSVTFASHEPEPGCEQTIKHGRPRFRLTGPDSYVAHSAGVTTVTYDTRESECGRVQLDMSFIDAAGREQLVYGDVVDYGVPCRVDPPAICPAGAAAILLDFPGRSTRNIEANPTGSAATAQFSIAPGCSGVVVSLVSYQKTTSAFLPQQFVDGAMGRFDAGGPYSLTVRLASCSMQADLYQGSYNPDEPLDQSNWASHYDARVLDWIYSGLCTP